MSLHASTYRIAVEAFDAADYALAHHAADIYLAGLEVYGPDPAARAARCPRSWVVEAAAKAEAIRAEAARRLAEGPS